MIVLSNSTAQALAPGQAISFDKVIMHTGRGECHNMQLPNSVKLCGKGIWEVHFTGNVTSATAGDTVQMAVGVANQPLVETAMNTSITTANALANISTETLIPICCCDLDRLSVINSGTTTVTIAPNTAFVLKRVA